MAIFFFFFKQASRLQIGEKGRPLGTQKSGPRKKYSATRTGTDKIVLLLENMARQLQGQA